jgi:methyl-accepting chemotaxis protein
MVKSLSIGKKFLLIALVSLIPLAFSTTLLFIEIAKRVESAEREKRGLDFHLALRRVLEAAAKHRELAVQARAGGTMQKSDADELGNQVKKALSAAGPLAKQGAWQVEAETTLRSIATAWEMVQRGAENRSAEETLTEHNEFVTYSLLPLMAETGRVSGLNVDPNPGSYHLVRVAVERLPPLIARIAEARSLVWAVAKRGQPSASEIEQIRALSVLAQADLDSIDADTKGLFKVNLELRTVLDTAFKDFDKKGNSFLRNLESTMTASKGGNITWDWIVQDDKSVEAGFTAYDRAESALAGLLGDRLHELANQRNVLIAINLSVIGVAALFGFFLLRSVRGAITRALAVADRVAGGDLSHSIEVHGDDETARLMQALKTMNQSLSRMVGEVHTGAESISSEVHQLVAGNRDLSQRTEAQASAIEETASSMEQLTASVRQNMDSAKETQRITNLAGDASRRGYQAVNQVVVHMASIQDSTKKVGEIVGLIDSIAFQTNILALNAAVEAARAGEQGRGFAVVAGEVRNLSKRCADSAREIRNLIRTSTEQVADGAKLVDEVVQTIDDINGRVTQVNDLMNQIVSASSEQSSGIDQVNQTINQMEKVTQQNAALVEQVLAATEALTEQTKRMSGLVSVFTLHASGTGREDLAPAPAPVERIASAGPGQRSTRALMEDRKAPRLPRR